MYKSRITGEMSFRVLIDIMDQSRKKNEELGITGFLLATDQEFLQVLEGSFEAVNEIYHSIAKDKRHEKMQLISFEIVKDRYFPKWTMKATSINELKHPLRNMLIKKYGTKDGNFIIPTDKYQSYALLKDAADIFK
jgi:hypothetical protein